MARFSRILALIALAAAIFAGMPARSDAQVSVGLSVSFGPPAIPYYVQPPAPGPNWIWQPGYWAWGPYGYYWVPGTWVQAPSLGLYWTPGYWAFTDGQYQWDPGYWGPVVGFYGGINYGYGYFGNGYVGGQWYGHTFRYNRAVTNINVSVIHNYYNNTAVVSYQRNWARNSSYRVAYNGGPHGVNARPTAYQQHAYAERRMAMTAQQTQHVRYAQSDPSLRYNANHGRPAIAAAARPFSATHRPVVTAHAEHAAPAHPAARPVEHAAPAYHPAARPVEHAAPAHAAPAHAAPARPAPRASRGPA